MKSYSGAADQCTVFHQLYILSGRQGSQGSQFSAGPPKVRDLLERHMQNAQKHSLIHRQHEALLLSRKQTNIGLHFVACHLPQQEGETQLRCTCSNLTVHAKIFEQLTDRDNVVFHGCLNCHAEAAAKPLRNNKF